MASALPQRVASLRQQWVDNAKDGAVTFNEALAYTEGMKLVDVSVSASAWHSASPAR